MTTAVALGTLLGPSQVLARVLEMVIGRHFHPIWTMLTSTVLVAAWPCASVVSLTSCRCRPSILRSGNGYHVDS